MASTLTLQSVANFCSTHADLLPLTGVGGYTSEPFLSIATDAMSELINDEQDWKWNSVEMCNLIDTFGPLVTCSNKQEYLFAGASAFIAPYVASGQQTNTTVQQCGAAIAVGGISVASGVVSVTFLEPHRFAVGNTIILQGVVMTTGTASAYNQAFSDNGSQTSWGSTFYTVTGTTTMGITFAAGTGQNNGDAGGAPGINNFGWLTGAQMMQLNTNSSPPNWRQMKAVRNLPHWSRVSDPEQVCVLQDYGNGVIRVRFSYVPSTVIWLVSLTYQKAAPAPFSSIIGATWAPIPDQFSYMIRQATLYRMYRYLNPNSAATVNERKLLDAAIAKAHGHDDAEESNVYLEPVEPLMDGYWPTYGSY